jgi:hypothetical protein
VLRLLLCAVAVQYLSDFLAARDAKSAAAAPADFEQRETFLGPLRHRAARLVLGARAFVCLKLCMNPWVMRACVHARLCVCVSVCVLVLRSPAPRCAAAGERLQREMAAGADAAAAWDTAQLDLVRAVRAHCIFTVARHAADGADAAPAAARPALRRLAALFALRQLAADAGDFLEDGHLSAAQAGAARACAEALLVALRPDAVALVDAFGIGDRKLNSALGRADGRAYEALWDDARRNPLNAGDVFDGYWQHLRPVLRGDAPEPAAAARL